MSDDNPNITSRLRVDAPVFIPQQQQQQIKPKAGQFSRRQRQRNRPKTLTKDNGAAPDGKDEAIRSRNRKGNRQRRRKKKEKMKSDVIDVGPCDEPFGTAASSVDWYSEEHTTNAALNGSLDNVVLPPSALSNAELPLKGSWAKPLNSSVLNPSQPLNEKDDDQGFRKGLVVLKKKNTKETTKLEYPTDTRTVADQPAVFCERGPKDTSKLMSRLWNAVAQHEKRLREREAMRKAEAEKEAARKRLENEEINQPVDLLPHQQPLHHMVELSTRTSLCDSVKHGSIQVLIQSLKTKEHSFQEFNEAIMLSIRLDLPDQLRILCNHLGGDYAVGRKMNKIVSMFDSDGSPLLYAVSEQRNSCLQAMLSAFNIGVLTSAKDALQNSALHVCCRLGTNETFLVIVNYIASQRNAQSNLLRCLSDRNQLDQTPIHIVCEEGHTEILDSLLTYRATCSITLLRKIMVLQDVRGQTPFLTAVQAGFEDIVMSLLMWRGNNSISFPKDLPSALTWAVRSGNKSMVLLLLEFNSTESEHGYDMEEALGLCIKMRRVEECNGESLEILSSLVAAGANPFHANEEEKSALDIAVSGNDSIAIESLLVSYETRLRVVRESRRRDPKLQMQPESFFRGIIESEETQKLAAARSALVDTLFRCWKSTTDDEVYASASCAIALYKHGTRPRHGCIVRLQEYMTMKNLSYRDTPLLERIPKVVTTSYDRLKGKPRNRLKTSGSLSFWSQQMIFLPWFGRTSESLSQTRCSWTTNTPASHDLDDTDAILFSTSKTAFKVHSQILTPCEKLSAAFRFATSSSTDEIDSKVEVEVGLNDEDLTLLLEHLYHGSMLSIRSKDRSMFASKLMDMMLISEEYLCLSLLQECEMRLLADNDTFGRCFCCFCLAKPQRTDSKDSVFRCTYAVSLPSALIDNDNVVDLLALLSQINIGHTDYCLEVSEPHSTRRFSKRPLEELREQLLIHSLSNFYQIIQSDSWKHHVNDATDVEASFLRLCLDDLHDCFINAKCQPPPTGNFRCKATQK